MRTDIYLYFIIISLSFIAYFLIIYQLDSVPVQNFYLFTITALIVRIILIPSEPFLSDDVYRYLWDGKVFFSGINPFSYAPTAEELLFLKDDVYYPYINFADIPTVYPPIAQVIFLLSYFIGYSLIIWKFLLLFFEILAVIFLLRIFEILNINKNSILIFILNPLLIMETYHSAHVDMAGVSLLIISVYYFLKIKNIRSTIFSASAFMIKFIALFFSFPMLLKHWKKNLYIYLIFIILCFIPFVWDGTIPVAGFISYSNRWEFNGFIHKLFTGFLDYVNLSSQELITLHYSGRSETIFFNSSQLYKIVVFILFTGFMIIRIRKYNIDDLMIIKNGFIFTTAILLLTPALYPWYLIWIIPFLSVFRIRALLLFTWLIQFSYYILQNYAVSGKWHENMWILAIQYIPFYILLLFDWYRKKWSNL